MKRLLVFTLVAAMMVLAVGCGSQGGQDTNSEAASEITAPGIGLVPMTEDSMNMMETLEEAVKDYPLIEMLQYKAGDNNEAIVRFEVSKKDGTWKTVEEQRLLLPEEEGYMTFLQESFGDTVINTHSFDAEFDGGVIMNNVSFGDLPDKFGGYATSDMFPDETVMGTMSDEEILAYEAPISLETKQPLEMFFAEEPLMVKDGKFVHEDEEGVIYPNISDIYTNKDGLYTDAYKSQKMMAFTIEFKYDENLEYAPYVAYKSDDTLVYDTGNCRGGLLKIMKQNKNGEWIDTADQQELLFSGDTFVGEIKFTGSLADSLKIDAPDLVTKQRTFKNQAKFRIANADKKSEKLEITKDSGCVKVGEDTILRTVKKGNKTYGLSLIIFP